MLGSTGRAGTNTKRVLDKSEPLAKDPSAGVRPHPNHNGRLFQVRLYPTWLRRLDCNKAHRKTAASTVDIERKPDSGLRQRIFEVLEHGRRREPASRAVDWLLVLLVLADVAATVAH